MRTGLGIDLRTSLSQTLTPQQIQYLKLLQLPVAQLEQYIQSEIESNPMLDEDISDRPNYKESFSDAVGEPDYAADEMPTIKEQVAQVSSEDKGDSFEFYKLLMQDDSTYRTTSYSTDDDESEPFQIKYQESFAEDLIKQFQLTELLPEEKLLGIQIIGNIDTDGYLRTDLDEILKETNDLITDHNFSEKQKYFEQSIDEVDDIDNPAAEFCLGEESLEHLNKASALLRPKIIVAESFDDFYYDNNDYKVNLLKTVNLAQAEKVLDVIRHLDPPGIGSRTIQESLTAQLEVIDFPDENQKTALDILSIAYDAFTKKHYHLIMKQLKISEETLKSALDVIRRLNPKPGGTEYYESVNVVIPDFIVKKDDDSEELIIILNDGQMPNIKLNKAYDSLKKESDFRKFNKETKKWIRSKYDDAKFLIQAIRQRKNTMMKIMTSIANRQREFFYVGESGMKPMIYKDVAEDTGLDISTVCRIVNNKFVQTDFGTNELKYFFSEALPSIDGEDVSTRIIKQALKDIIEKESKNKPYSDDKLSDMLNKAGYQVARRTVAKYREQLRIPVARLRREL